MVLPSLRFFRRLGASFYWPPLAPALEAKRLWEIEGLPSRAPLFLRSANPAGFLFRRKFPTANGGREGWIAKADLSGRLTERWRWLTGLEDPRGLCACGASPLFIADGKTVAVASISKGRVLARWKAPGAVGLESVAVSTTCAVYAADPGRESFTNSPRRGEKALARGRSFGNRRGCYLTGLSKRLVAVSRGRRI